MDAKIFIIELLGIKDKNIGICSANEKSGKLVMELSTKTCPECKSKTKKI